jgi:gas vesicle protein
MQRSNNSGKIVSALLLGAGIGAVLGILFAPDKGSETRRRLSEKSQDLAETTNGKIESFVADVKKETDKAKEMANELIESGADIFEKRKVNQF